MSCTRLSFLRLCLRDARSPSAAPYTSPPSRPTMLSVVESQRPPEVLDGRPPLTERTVEQNLNRGRVLFLVLFTRTRNGKERMLCPGDVQGLIQTCGAVNERRAWASR